MNRDHRASVSFEPASRDERPLLENLAQLYAYDFSDMLDMHVAHDGRFGNIDLAPYWLDDWRHPFLLRVDEKLAGFALISARSKITSERGIHDMTEFFVLRRFRRQGIGRAAAFAAFDRFRGPWEIRQRDENPAATTFWRRTIAAYTDGNYKESRWHRPHWTEVVQTFAPVSAPRPR